eukprot:NODE_438_length_8605_cov_0.277334.p3 type:complete len:117 gc:universal NODE_438_length_8605_cov_0.277334:4258-3908(-)
MLNALARSSKTKTTSQEKFFSKFKSKWLNWAKRSLVLEILIGFLSLSISILPPTRPSKKSHTTSRSYQPVVSLSHTSGALLTLNSLSFFSIILEGSLYSSKSILFNQKSAFPVPIR